MSQVESGESKTGRIIDYFVVETRVLQTRTADLFIAQDKLRADDVSLWQARSVVNTDPVFAEEYQKRMARLQSITPPVCDMLGFAVDHDGIPFAVLARLDGNILTEGSPEPSEIERRFVSCVDIVSKIHSASVVCGDICKNSFWINRAGNVRFIGVMGALDPFQKDAPEVAPELASFMAPEQRQSGQLDLRSDVYALGVLGYFLFTASTDLVVKSEPEKLKKIPSWLVGVLSKATEKDPKDRFQNAQEFFQAIKAHHGSGLEDSDGINRKNRTSSGSQPATGLTLGKAIPVDKKPVLTKKFLILLGSCLVAGVVVAALIPVYNRYAHSIKLSHALSAHQAIAGSELKEAIHGLISAGQSSEGRRVYLDKIVSSDDPVAHAVLVTLSRNSSSDDVRRDCENAILERAKRSGLLRSADVVANWLAKFGGRGSTEGYTEDVLISLDNSLPADTRTKAIRRVYADNSGLALMLASSYALDLGSLEEYRVVLAQLLGDRFKRSDLETRSVPALILSSEIISDYFGRDALDIREQMPDPDVLWLLGLMADRDDSRAQFVAETAINRNLIDSRRRYFLSLVKDRPDIPPEVTRSLIHAAIGKIKAEDIASFGRWYDSSIEEILLALCSMEQDPDVLYEVFDTVASRTIVNPIAASLIDWVKKNYWDTRLEFVNSIGVLSLGDQVSVDDIDDIRGALSTFDRYVVDKDLLGALISAKSSKVVVAVIDRFREVIPPSNLLLLLKDHDRAVRLASISALARLNDVGALRVIIESYEIEMDEEVKRAYEEQFWVIKQRVGKK